MKRFLLIGLLIAFILIIVGGAGVVYARMRGVDNITAVTVNTTQNGEKIIQQFGYGPGGMMGQNTNRNGLGGMMGGNWDDYGPGGMMGGDGFGYRSRRYDGRAWFRPWRHDGWSWCGAR